MQPWFTQSAWTVLAATAYSSSVGPMLARGCSTSVPSRKSVSTSLSCERISSRLGPPDHVAAATSSQLGDGDGRVTVPLGDAGLGIGIGVGITDGPGLAAPLGAALGSGLVCPVDTQPATIAASPRRTTTMRISGIPPALLGTRSGRIG